MECRRWIQRSIARKGNGATTTKAHINSQNAPMTGRIHTDTEKKTEKCRHRHVRDKDGQNRKEDRQIWIRLRQGVPRLTQIKKQTKSARMDTQKHSDAYFCVPHNTKIWSEYTEDKVDSDTHVHIKHKGKECKDRAKM